MFTCEGCNGTGVLVYDESYIVTCGLRIPPGYFAIEACLTCNIYKDDLAAGRAWSHGGKAYRELTDWMWGNGTSYVIDTQNRVKHG